MAAGNAPRWRGHCNVVARLNNRQAPIMAIKENRWRIGWRRPRLVAARAPSSISALLDLRDQ